VCGIDAAASGIDTAARRGDRGGLLIGSSGGLMTLALGTAPLFTSFWYASLSHCASFREASC